MMDATEINEPLVRRILELVDHGLVSGLGTPEPGKMCIEAVVCYAMGLPHSDEPTCVSPMLRSLKIKLNDRAWSSDQARAKGLRRLAVAQLGSAGVLDEKAFSRRLVDYALRVSTPMALRAAASVQRDETHKAKMIEAANRCEKEGTRQAARDGKADAAAAADAAYAAYAAYAADAYAAYAADAYAAAAADAYAAAAAYAAYAADAYAAAYAAAAAAARKTARDKALSDYAEGVVQILIDLKAPGCQWLWLTEA